MREYETTVIVQPEISAEGTESILAKLDSALERGGAVRLMCADLGKRKLAYEIRKFQKGHYYTLSFADKGQVIPELERTLRMEESVLRFMTIQVDADIADLDARKERGAALEVEQKKRAVEKAEREAEELRARAEVERLAAEEAKANAEAAAAAAASEAKASETTGAEAEASGTEAGAEDAPPTEEAASASAETPAAAEAAATSSDKAPASDDASAAPASDASSETPETPDDGDKS